MTEAELKGKVTYLEADGRLYKLVIFPDYTKVYDAVSGQLLKTHVHLQGDV